MAQATKTNDAQQTNQPPRMPQLPLLDAFTHMAPFVQDGIDRMQALYEELALVEQAAYDRSKELSAQFNTMVSGTMDYATALTREWRQITLDATQRTAQLFREKA